MSDSSTTEPWLRGDIDGVHPVIAQVLYTFRQAEEELQKWTQDLSAEQIGARPYGLASVGFHLRHISGSVGRLLTYAQGHGLSAEQFDELRVEMNGTDERDRLLTQLSEQFRERSGCCEISILRPS
ncbi:MAG: hypothetical protein WKF37_00405 [Bryobacteraceae bacterium]